MSIEPNLIRHLRDSSRNRDVSTGISLLQRKFGIDLSMPILTRPNMTNQDLWSYIQRIPPPGGVRAYGQESDRAQLRANDIKGIVSILSGVDTGVTYLDVGSNTGEIAYATSSALNLDPERVYGLDEGEFSGMAISKTAPINHITYDARGRIPLPGHAVDLITILQTIHHIRNLTRFMIELKRISRIGSLVIIREHDMPSYPGSGAFKYIIDLEHLIWSAREDKPDNTYNNFASTYWARYYAPQELVSVFTMFGFEPVSLPSSYSKPFGATRYYYAAFRRIR